MTRRIRALDLLTFPIRLAGVLAVQNNFNYWSGFAGGYYFSFSLSDSLR